MIPSKGVDNLQHTAINSDLVNHSEYDIEVNDRQFLNDI
jgi:hypothetical protein